MREHFAETPDPLGGVKLEVVSDRPGPKIGQSSNAVKIQNRDCDRYDRPER